MELIFRRFTEHKLFQPKVLSINISEQRPLSAMLYHNRTYLPSACKMGKSALAIKPASCSSVDFIFCVA